MYSYYIDGLKRSLYKLNLKHELTYMDDHVPPCTVTQLLPHSEREASASAYCYYYSCHLLLFRVCLRT
jgi:hypothetical protein